jgi:hypothetical protein
MKYKNVIKLRLPEIQMLAVVPMQLKFNIVKDHDEPTIILSETLFCMWECFNMGTELPTKVMLGQTLVFMQMTFLNNVRKVGRLVLSRTSCFLIGIPRTQALDSVQETQRFGVLNRCVYFKRKADNDYGVGLRIVRFLRKIWQHRNFVTLCLSAQQAITHPSSSLNPTVLHYFHWDLAVRRW